jgi:hypothetical protein
MLFTLPACGIEFSELIDKWYGIFHSFEDALALYYSVIRGHVTVIEARFLLIAQALEIFHRRRFGNATIPKAEHNRRVRQIVAASPPVHKEWLRDALSHSNEPSLRSRLAALRQHAGSAFVRGTPESLPKRLADSRNYHTHWDERLKNSAARGEDLASLTDGAIRMFQLCILNELGFDDDQRTKSMSTMFRLENLRAQTADN